MADRLPRYSDFQGSKSVEDLARRVSESMRDLLEYLRSQPRIVRKDFEHEAGNEVLVSVPFDRPPMAVLLVRAEERDTPGDYATPYTPQWTWESGQVRITAITGLVGGTVYKLTLLVIGEVQT